MSFSIQFTIFFQLFLVYSSSNAGLIVGIVFLEFKFKFFTQKKIKTNLVHHLPICIQAICQDHKTKYYNNGVMITAKQKNKIN